ncbi:hypothetical protein [Bacteroides sp.]
MMMSKTDFNYSRLCEIVFRLNNRLLDVVRREKKGLISEKEIELLERNDDTDDCYNSLAFQYIREVKKKDCCLVCIHIEFKDERSLFSNCFVGTPNQIRRQFSSKKGERFVREIIDRMIYGRL